MFLRRRIGAYIPPVPVVMRVKMPPVVALLSAAAWILLQLPGDEASPTHQAIRSAAKKPSSARAAAAARPRSLLGSKLRNRDVLPLPRFMDWEEYEESLREKEAGVPDGHALTDVLPEGWRWDRYHSSSEVEQLLESLQAAFPSVASSFSIGESTMRRPLMAIKVVMSSYPSSFPHSLPRVHSIMSVVQLNCLLSTPSPPSIPPKQIGEAPELSPGTPEVKLVGNMHGDEAAGCEMLLRLSWDLCRLYNTSSGVRMSLKQTLAIRRISCFQC